MNYNESAENQLISDLGYDFGDIAKIESPEEAIAELLRYVGVLFQCERVYIFEKDEAGMYDCTDEWVKDPANAKKELLQNLSSKSVRYYYNYFIRGEKLIIKDMDAFKQEDYALYKLLSPQNLSSLLCGQLVYDDKDRGFLGVDNPSPDRFEELSSLFGVLCYYVSILLHRREMKKRIHTLRTSTETNGLSIPSKLSMYEKTSQLKKEEPLALVYCSVRMNGDQPPVKTVEEKAEQVLVSLFLSENVFALGNGEFVIVFEDSPERDIYSIRHYMDLAFRTLQTMNIVIFMGVVTTERYEDNFFYLLNQANTNMLRDKREYRKIFTAKYHMSFPTEAFSELLEIHPSEDTFRVLYQERNEYPLKDGKINDFLLHVQSEIYSDDQRSFLDFWKKIFDEPEEPAGETWKEVFRISRDSKEIRKMNISVIKTSDVKGNTIYFCYTN